jgi:hypothetical protein
MKALKNIGLIFVVSMLILATGGFSVYQHVCHCAGEMSASLFMQESCDHQEAAPVASCCKPEDTKSCCKPEPVRETRHTCHNDDCCKTTSLFLKISDSFQPGLEKVNLKPIMMVAAILTFELSEDILFTPHLNICNSDLPPPDTGKHILIALHQLKLDTHLV